MMKIALLGAGLQGNICCTDLCDKELSPAEKEIIVADYDYDKAKEVADKFGLKAVQLDVRDHDKLVETIKGSDIVISALTRAESNFCSDDCYNESCKVIPILTLVFQNCDLFFDHIYMN